MAGLWLAVMATPKSAPISLVANIMRGVGEEPSMNKDLILWLAKASMNQKQAYLDKNLLS